MTAKEKAQKGLAMLKDAVHEYVSQHPDGVPPREVREALGLDSPNEKDQRKDHLLWGVHNLLEREGRVKRTLKRNRSILFPA